jgi:hypothetical protein
MDVICDAQLATTTSRLAERCGHSEPVHGFLAGSALRSGNVFLAG